MFRVLDRVQRRRGRHAVAIVIAITLGGFVAAAHSGIGSDHMGEAVAMCVAVTATAAVAVAAVPALGRLLPASPRARSWNVPASFVRLSPLDLARARGHPAVLQVFRR